MLFDDSVIAHTMQVPVVKIIRVVLVFDSNMATSGPMDM
jgi:hypothetical protein